MKNIKIHNFVETLHATSLHDQSRHSALDAESHITKGLRDKPAMTNAVETRYVTSLLFALLLSCTALNAQHRRDAARHVSTDHIKHEFSLHGGGGLSFLQYNAAAGQSMKGLGGRFGLGYHFFFSQNWGIGTGVEYALYNTLYKLDDYSLRYMTIDKEGNDFEFRTTVNSYKEKQHSAMLQIPLMLQFQNGKKHQFYAAVGAKIGIPLGATYKGSDATLQNSGYYAKENYEYTTQKFMGFGTFNDKNVSGDLSFKTAFFASAEVGMKWKLSESRSLYTGVYMDYGLNNIRNVANVETGRAPSPNAPSPRFIEYNTENPRDFALNSAVNSYTQDGSQAFIDKITPMSIGVTLRLSFGKKQKKKKTISIVPLMETDTITEKQRLADSIANVEAQRAAEQARIDSLADVETRRAASERMASERAAEQARIDSLADVETRRATSLRERTNALHELQQPIQDYNLAQFNLNDHQQQQWNRKIEIMQQYPEVNVFIYGHTCNIGSPEVNEQVGLQRAENVKAYLLSKGIAESRILGTASKRDTEPIAPNDSEANRKNNRRTELKITEN